MRRDAGFTLIELILVIIIVSVGFVGLTGSFSNFAKSRDINESLQQAAQYAQECAERAIATRREQQFTWFASNTFTCGNNPTGFTRTASVGSVYTGTSTSACPNGVSCRNITITATSVSNASISSSITVMLVNY